MLNEKFVIVGGVLTLIGSSGYAIDTLRGKTQPNRITWFLWALAPLIAFAAEIVQGVGLRSLMTFMAGFGPLMVFGASLVNRKAFWQASRLDYVCGALSVVALSFWALTRSGDIAIAFSILADLTAGLPTIVKAYREPETEDARFFLLYAISALITLLTITTWSFANMAFPLFSLILCVMLFVLIKFKPGKRRPSDQILP